MKIQSEKEIIRQDEHNLDDSDTILILQYHPIQIQQYSFASESSTKSNSRYKFKFYFVSSYVEKTKQSLDETYNIFP